MPYVYNNPKALEGKPSVGNKQCVALVKFYAKAPASSLWREGASVKGNMLLREGTAIATFVDGRYPNHASGNHAALYVGQDAGGIYVIDQWSKVNKIQARKLRFLGKDKHGGWTNPSNNGDAFSVVE
ncbi:BPSL0067 family protein [Paracidovorax avenae]|uniref:BPSL0067 family protein n=1 Tax=Paracidovorax avenae TaxID=80867 RepID=UPI001F45D5ED|nr:BPSL0067 family protein [Paracidovorax avenae]